MNSRQDNLPGNGAVPTNGAIPTRDQALERLAAVADDPATIVVGDQEHTLDKLKLALRNRQGRFALLFVVCNEFPLRRRLVRQIKTGVTEEYPLGLQRTRGAWQPENGLADQPLVEVQLNGDEVSLLDKLLLAPGAPQPLFVYGLEKLLPSSNEPARRSRREATLYELQLNRERFRNLGRPLVLWMPEYVYTMVGQQAVDFWSWQSGAFFFTETQGSKTGIIATSDTSEDKNFLGRTLQGTLSLTYELVGKVQPNDLQRLWRQLTIFPTTFDNTAAAAVWQMGINDTTNALAELIRYGLVDYDTQSERYALHDLVRVFAAARMGEAERETAQFRHAHHFCAVLARAGNLYLEGGEKAKFGLALYDRERANIEAGWAWVESHLEKDRAAAELCAEYPKAGAYVIDLQLPPRERIRWLEAQLAAARRLKLRDYEAAALGNLGVAYRQLGQPRKAIEFYEQSLALHRGIGDRRNEGAGLGNLGIAYKDLGEPRKAIEFHEQALAISRAIGDRRGEGETLGNL